MPEQTFEYIGPMRVHFPGMDPSVTLTVEGLSQDAAAGVAFNVVIDLAKKLLGEYLKSEGGSQSGGSSDCVTTTVDTGKYVVTTTMCPKKTA